MDKLLVLSGLYPVQGGVTVHLDDKIKEKNWHFAKNPEQTRIEVLIHDKHLSIHMNCGQLAEAISINNQRIINSTDISVLEQPFR